MKKGQNFDREKAEKVQMVSSEQIQWVKILMFILKLQNRRNMFCHVGSRSKAYLERQINTLH